MWQYNKKLEYPVKIKQTNPAMAKLIISQFGGPDGELGAALRYLSQRYGCPTEQTKGLLTDIGTEEPILPPTPREPAWGLDFGCGPDSWGIEVSKLHLFFSGKADKRCCRVLEAAETEKMPGLSGAWMVEVKLGLEG